MTCPTCGDVDIPAGEVKALVCSHDRSCTYAFRCRGCRIMITKPTSERVVAVLAGSGVELVTWDLPAELGETRSGPPICWDDVLEFHFLIAEEGALNRAVTELSNTHH